VNEMPLPVGVEPVATPSWRKSVIWVALPLLALVAATGWLLSSDLLGAFNNGAPPIENLTFERTVLDNEGVHLLVRGGGAQPLVIAQVQVDAAYWDFAQDPPGEIARGATAWLNIPYTWVLGEPFEVTAVTRTGTTISHQIDVAVPTPTATSGQLIPQAYLGAFVGILPVAIGLMFYPALRGVGRRGMDFLLALTIGLLAFLLVDMGEEALDIAGETAALFQGHLMVIFAAAASFLLLFAVGRRAGTPNGMALSAYIALGIGLHNLGEGLAIGAAFASGAVGLGSFLVLGFTLHNITEGIGIAAPLVKLHPRFIAFVGLALLAGAPAIVGMWLGSLAYSPQWTALALAIGAGAIIQVIVEVGAFLARSSGIGWAAFVSPRVLAGLAIGVAFMYGTAMAVAI
jgi:ZIP family zinc transporter